MKFTFQPHAFYLQPAVNTTPSRTVFDFLYYSFGAMTTLRKQRHHRHLEQGRSLTIVQSILGTFYLAVLIARLMTAYRSLGSRAGKLRIFSFTFGRFRLFLSSANRAFPSKL